eukprot:XP_014037397.1 PREDICTED: CMRF35-like molecule 1 [Salmo salar]
MKILHVVSCCLLSALCVVESVITKATGVVGGQVTIQCSYADKWFVKSNDRYFCRKKCDSYNDILVQTQKNKNYIERGRYTIHDYRNGDFTVTIKNLMKSDSGTYWCGLDRYIKDSYQEVHLTVTDAPPKPSTVTSRPHFSTILPILSTTLSDISATLSNISTMFLASGDISGNSSSREGLMVWTSAGLVVMVTVLGLVLLLFYRQRRGTRRTPPPPVSSNTQPDPTGEVDCVYEEIREADRQTDTLPVVISLVYSTVNSPTTYPAGQASTTYPASSATDSRVSSSPPTASRTQDDSIYSTAQLPKDSVESTRYPAVHLSKDTPEDAIYSTAQLPQIM